MFLIGDGQALSVPDHAKREFEVTCMDALMEALGYTFQTPALLDRALTHPSMGAEDNQRLEFLGDAVLQYVMSDLLFKTHPTRSEERR